MCSVYNNSNAIAVYPLLNHLVERRDLFRGLAITDVIHNDAESSGREEQAMHWLTSLRTETERGR